MEPNSNLSHPKPLAFTETFGASALRRAVYRSAALWRYCVAMQEANKIPSADLLYKQYLTDADIVVIDDATYIDKAPEEAASQEPFPNPNSLTYDQRQEYFGNILRDLHLNLPFPEDEDDDD